jgi:predicted nucleic acid-binding protein
MRKVVSNTTPILSLLKIEKLNLLKELYGTVYIPYAVFREIETGKDKEFYINLKTTDWIKIEKIHSTLARTLLFDLDDGEAETLVLAQEINADLVIIDEKCGRRYAKKDTWINQSLIEKALELASEPAVKGHGFSVLSRGKAEYDN